MLNPEYSQETEILSYESYAASWKQDKIGDTIVTNEIGTIGHHYAKWEVISKIEDGEKIQFKASRVA